MSALTALAVAALLLTSCAAAKEPRSKSATVAVPAAASSRSAEPRTATQRTPIEIEARGALLHIVFPPDTHLELVPRAWTDSSASLIVRGVELEDTEHLPLPDNDLVRSAAIENNRIELVWRKPKATAWHFSEPGIVTVFPTRCRGCALEAQGCIQWVTDSCGDDATCAMPVECEDGCC